MTDMMNGISHDLEALERNKQRIDGMTELELPPASARPFDQKAHDLMLQSIDQVAADWMSELAHVRQNSEQVEQLVLQRAAKVKADITALYLLGNAAMAEARRGDNVNAKLADELDKLADELDKLAEL